MEQIFCLIDIMKLILNRSQKFPLVLPHLQLDFSYLSKVVFCKLWGMIKYLDKLGLKELSLSVQLCGLEDSRYISNSKDLCYQEEIRLNY